MRLLILFLVSTSAFAASFDCSKASTPTEKTICATPRLSALDDELASTYASSRKHDGQQAWLAERDECGDYDECIEASYLTRIATLRLKNRALFAKQAAPANVIGRYSEQHPNCHPSETDPNTYDCVGTLEHFVEIGRAKGNALTVDSELWFYNGHLCSIDKGQAEWVGGELRVAMGETPDEPRCVLLMKFSGDDVSLVDPAARCKDASCGARGSFDETTLPKKKIAGSLDCAKAGTKAEETICATPRLLALDEELAATYAAARKLGGDAVRDAQKKWLTERDDCEEIDECIEAAYLVRIESLRLQYRKLFANEQPPAKILGRYSETSPNCGEEDGDEDAECTEEVESYIDVRRKRGNELVVNAETWFYMGHQCNVNDAPAEWVGGEVRAVLSYTKPSEPECVLILRFEGDEVFTVDPVGRCRGAFCGARAGFHDFSLPRKK